MAASLRQIRRLIDNSDRKLVALLAKRFQYVAQAGECKRREGQPVRDLQREQEIVKKMADLAREFNLDRAFLKALFALIFKHSRKFQNKRGK